MLQGYQKIEDLLTDESFLAWYHRTNEQDILVWDQWILINPDSQRLVEDAVLFLDSLKIHDEPVSTEQMMIAEKRIMGRLNMLDIPLKKTTGFWKMNWMRVAASFVLIAISAIVVRQAFFSKSAVSTNYGEMKMQILPDGTEVLLNAHSEVSFAADWEEGSERNVWINGEAFFHVKKTPDKSRFIVHTKQFDIHVTGTRFNVMDRNGKSNILLSEGQVILKRSAGTDIIMSPGDFLEYTDKGLEKKAMNNDNVIAWKERKLVFDNTPLHEVVKIIKEHYGETIILEDLSLGNVRLTGMMPNDNLEVLIDAIAALNEFKVVRKDAQIILTKVQSNNID